MAAAPATGIRWNLTSLFSGLDDPKIEATWQEAEERAARFEANWRGKVEPGQLSAAELAKALAELESLGNEASKPVIYGHLLFAGDAGDPKIGAFLQAQSERVSKIRVGLMFFELELQAAPEAWVEAVLADPAMSNYVHHVRTVRVYSPYRLSEAEEALLEETSNVGGRAWTRLHDELLSNHEFSYQDPRTGERSAMSESEVLNLLRDGDRAIRQAAADALSDGLAQHERTLCFIYNTLLADKKLEDRLRKFDYPEQSRHMANELDRETVDLVMRLCRDKGSLVARYYHVKRRLLGLDQLTHIDRYAPLSRAKRTVTWDEARGIVEDSFAAFHPEMKARAAEFFDQAWIDAEPRQGKTGGAFCSYATPDTHPFVLMTYLGTMDGVMTLAHELGHGVHSSLSRAQTPYNYHGTLPLAELASIFGEMLVFERLVAESGPEDQLALYGEKIEGIFASVFRQSAMFRFEQRCHLHRRSQGELSPSDFGGYWQEELQSMFGDSVEMGNQHSRWWSYVGHFIFAPFYVYAYSFGELLTLAVFQKAKQEGPAFAEKYLEVLRRGGSQSPQELMDLLGVRLDDESFWLGGFAAIEAMIERFEALAA